MRRRAALPTASAARDVRRTAGKVLRKECPRDALAISGVVKRDPVATLRQSNQHRLARLVPIRYARMLVTPFTFLRGAAALMARDISRAPSPGIHAQICGDCHLGNFGGFASPERKLIFGINDFDETLPGAFEWDIKRLVASFFVAARCEGISETRCADIVARVGEVYRERIEQCAQMSALDVWYERYDLEKLVNSARSKQSRAKRDELGRLATRSDSWHAFPKMTELSETGLHICDHPPLIYHPHEMPDFQRDVRRFWEHYVESLPEERRALAQRYEVVDVAMKVVGVGSVGTRCAVALLMSAGCDPLFLQFKEASTSVYAPFAGASAYENQGQRVVIGQRIMQAASDIFLGFSRATHVSADFYVRQLRDRKVSFFFEAMKTADFLDYADACAWTLASAHAKSADPAVISGYLGRGDEADQALVRFARSYADQTEKDHEALKRAAASGQINVASTTGSD